MKILAHPKMPFCAPPGKLIVEADYSGQETRAAAALSKDRKMVESFLAEPFVLGPDNKQYPNPASDMHCLSAVHCINPEWFEDTPEYLWVPRSRETPIGQKDCPRAYGKTLNFATAYLSTARSIAEANHVPLKTAEEWEKRHKSTYPGYYEWAAEVGRIASARGYAINTRGRWRFVDESNAKGSGESMDRNAVNHMVQSYCADMTKEADLQCREEFKGTDVVCLLAVHDALMFEIPGYAELDPENCKIKDGVYSKLAYKVNDEAQEITNRIISIMEKVETEMFQDVGSPVPGKAEAGISLFWDH